MKEGVVSVCQGKSPCNLKSLILLTPRVEENKMSVEQGNGEQYWPGSLKLHTLSCRTLEQASQGSSHCTKAVGV